MTAGKETDWRAEFGFGDWGPPKFFTRIDDVGAEAPQAHALRRAFDVMKLDGILCLSSSPLIYFKQVPEIKAAEVRELRSLFWNQGIAPILALISPEQVHIYSGLSLPPVDPAADTFADAAVTIQRTTAELQKFIASVGSGEFFRAHRLAFDPTKRVDRELLRNLQDTRKKLDAGNRKRPIRPDPTILDALLCRLVFTCYLFDRDVIGRSYLESIGIRKASHLRDILARESRDEAKAELYCLFERLRIDFNGDLFSDDLRKESEHITPKHLELLDRFFGTTDANGQGRFWPYNFGVIPIETISAIYEHFLKAAGAKKKKEAGAFYTPRFLAELVLDIALAECEGLLEKRFLDPACGSGIFLVGLFNRLAEEWRRLHPNARYQQRATGLLKILTSNIFGVDENPTACRITAFSLYLAFLDQLSPPAIQELQRKGNMLPLLLDTPERLRISGERGVIRRTDFFAATADLPVDFHSVIGNPPWASVKDRQAPVAQWFAEKKRPFPDRQIATGFILKACDHLAPEGKVCFVLPHGTLFNHRPPAVKFQKSWMQEHAVELVLNLADYQRFLFEEAEAPAIVARFRKEPAANGRHRIDYWAPKTDWSISRADIMNILPQDRTRITLREVLEDLESKDAPLIWKGRFWATPRDRRLLNRLSLLPRLRNIVRSPSDTGEEEHSSDKKDKPWLMAEGFQPLSPNDDRKKARVIELPTKRFIPARSKAIRLFLLESDCEKLRSKRRTVREKSNKNTMVFQAPHVLVAKGMKRSAFADFDVSFQHALRGIHGPKSDRDRLIFLAAYLQSKLARYYLFHTSSNWGVSRAEVHVRELRRLPFPLPDETSNPQRSREIIQEVAAIITQAKESAEGTFLDRQGEVQSAQARAERLIEEYFDIDPVEKALIEDTNKVIIPSARPTRKRLNVPTLKSSSAPQRDEYTEVLAGTLSEWAQDGKYKVRGHHFGSESTGIGVVVLEKVGHDETSSQPDTLNGSELLALLKSLQTATSKSYSAFELVLGVKVFHRNLLYIVKPIGQRFWTRTAALNDADEIAATIIMRPDNGGIA